MTAAQGPAVDLKLSSRTKPSCQFGPGSGLGEPTRHMGDRGRLQEKASGRLRATFEDSNLSGRRNDKPGRSLHLAKSQMPKITRSRLIWLLCGAASIAAISVAGARVSARLFADDRRSFTSLIAPWPADIRDHIVKLAYADRAE